MSSTIGSLADFVEFAEFQLNPPQKAREIIEWFSDEMGAYYTPIGSGWKFFVHNACHEFTAGDKEFLKKLSAEHKDAATKHSNSELLRLFKQFVDKNPTNPGYFLEIVTLADFIQLRSLIKMFPSDCVDPWERFFGN
jgi:hypothetical protein